MFISAFSVLLLFFSSFYPIFNAVMYVATDVVSVAIKSFIIHTVAAPALVLACRYIVLVPNVVYMHVSPNDTPELATLP